MQDYVFYLILIICLLVLISLLLFFYQIRNQYLNLQSQFQTLSESIEKSLKQQPILIQNTSALMNASHTNTPTLLPGSVRDTQNFSFISETLHHQQPQQSSPLVQPSNNKKLSFKQRRDSIASSSFKMEKLPPPIKEIPKLEKPSDDELENDEKELSVIIQQKESEIEDDQELFISHQEENESTEKTVSSLASTMSYTPSEDEDSTLKNLDREISLPLFLKCDLETNVRMETIIGKGGGGIIYEAEPLKEDWNQKYKKVAVKIISQEALQDEFCKSNFESEVSIMHALTYCPNIIQLLGYTMQTEPVLSLAYITPKYDENLHVWVHDLARPLKYLHAFVMISDLVDGFSFMHQRGIVHRDIKSANILVDRTVSPGFSGVRAVICDFGLSISLDQPKIVGQVKNNAVGISIRYASPEVFKRIKRSTTKERKRGDHSLDKKSDVYAFGVVLWEVLHRKQPWKGLKPEEIEENLLAGIGLEIKKELLMSQEAIVISLIKILKYCIQLDPNKRPSFVGIKKRIEKLT